MSFNIFKLPGRLLMMTALVVVTSIASYGQSVGNMEVSGNLGVVSRIGGSHGSFGGSIGAPVTDRLILSGDLSYIPMGGGSVTALGSTTRSSAKAFNFNGNLQYQFNPFRGGTVPYAGAGLGFLHSSFDASSNVVGSGFNISGSSTDLYFNVGGGLRYYVKERWGFRPEFMVFAGSNTYVRFAGGFFYQFGE
jgi:hypothetical protein